MNPKIHTIIRKPDPRLKITQPHDYGHITQWHGYTEVPIQLSEEPLHWANAPLCRTPWCQTHAPPSRSEEQNAPLCRHYSITGGRGVGTSSSVQVDRVNVSSHWRGLDYVTRILKINKSTFYIKIIIILPTVKRITIYEIKYLILNLTIMPIINQ